MKKIKSFILSVSGSNQALLNQYPREFHKHLNIGITILFVTLLAFCSGSLAGYYFGNNIFSTLTFGMLWALLVFVVDRNMVSTLEKSPKTKPVQLILPVIYRIILSGAIAFFISIPMELWMFRDNIELQRAENNQEYYISYKEDGNDKYNLPENETALLSIQEQQDEIDSLLTMVEPPLSHKKFHSVKGNLKSLQIEIHKRQNDLNSKIRERQIIYAQIPEVYDSLRGDYIKDKSTLKYRVWQKLYADTNSKNGPLFLQLKKLQNQERQLNAELDSISESYFSQLNGKKQSNEEKYAKLENIHLEKTQNFESELKNYDGLLSNADGFISKWTALNSIENSWIEFFIWFLRFFFFVIEMLPVLTKLSTPPGSYEMEAWAEKERRKIELENEIAGLRMISESTKSEISESSERKRQISVELEEQTHRRITEMIGNFQEDVAKRMMEMWQEIQMEKIEKDPQSYIK